MTNIDEAVAFLKERGIESFGLMGILTIPIKSAEHLDQVASDISKLLKECGYEKSWRIDPYFYERHESLAGAMFD